MKKLIFLIMAVITFISSNCLGQSSARNTPDSSKKKVLVIVSSPNKGGNSDLLCDEFITGAKAAGHDTEKVFLNDLEIGFLKVKDDYTDRNIGIKDDAPIVLDKMIKADVIVMATPIWNGNMNGQMKTMMDRVFEREHEVANKEFYFIMTAGGYDVECALLCFRNFIKYLPGSKEKGVIKGTGSHLKGSIKGKSAMTDAYEMGQNV